MLKVNKESVRKTEYVTVIALITFVSLWVRHCLIPFKSLDYDYYLEPWYNTIVANGKIHSLNETVGNYNLLYQTIIAGLTYLPLSAIRAYKWLSIIFDYMLAVLALVIIKQFVKAPKQQVLVFAIASFLPTVVINSAMWGQCDAIYTFFVLLSAFLLSKNRVNVAFASLGVALAFKLQAIFALPFLGFVYLFLNRKTTKVSIVHFLWLPAIMVSSGMVCYIMGQKDIFKVFKIYLHQTEEYPYLYANYPSFWVIFFHNNDPRVYYAKYSKLALITTLVVLIVLFVLIARQVVRKSYSNSKIYYILLFVFSYTCVFFLPAMHERYGYMYVVLAVLLCFLDKKTIPACLILQLISVMTYLHFLINTKDCIVLCAVINAVAYGYYLIWTIDYLKKDNDTICEDSLCINQ